MKKLLLTFLAMIFVCPLFAADEKRATRIDFTSEPTGAKVYVNGTLRGVTPLSVHDASAGTCRARFELENYEWKEEIFAIEDGAYLTKHADLASAKGLLLVTTEPAGCHVSLDGLSFGETPRLITSLDCTKTHRLKLEKAGYQPRFFDVKFSGRTPLTKHEKLILDSGVLNITTTPAGATVTINDLVRGETPLVVRDIPKGEATVLIKLDGYKDITRKMTLNAGDEQKLALTLEGLPGALSITSIPEGARVYLNDSFQGKTPLSVSNVTPKQYRVRVECDGYATSEKTIDVANGKTVAEEFRLESILGRLELRTQPAGVGVSVDGKFCGTTKPAAGSVASEIFIVENLRVGQHSIVLKADGYAQMVKRPKIKSQATTTLDVKLRRLFTPNIHIETETGKYDGVLVHNGAERVVIETSPGISRAFPREDIKKIEVIEARP